MNQKVPSKEAIAQAMQTPQGQRIKEGTANIADWITVVAASEMIQEAMDALVESTANRTTTQ